MTRICFILGSHWSYSKGGSEYQAELLMDSLKKNSSYRLYYIYAGSRYAKVDMEGVRFYVLPRRKALSKLGRSFFFDSLRLLRILNNIQPDVIYQRVGSAYTGIAAYYAKNNNCRMIWHIGSENDVKPSRFTWKRAAVFDYLDRKLFEYGIENADYIVGQAKYQDGFLRRNYGRKCDLILPNFHPMPKRDIRKGNPIKVVWISNFKRLKQPEIFIELAGELKSYKDVKFIMIGRPGPKDWQAELETKIDKLNNLEYLGEKPIDEVNRILCESHIFVNTSIYEGFPNTFIQAWMRKVPVVSLNVDPDGIIEKEKIGFHSRTFEQMVQDVRNLLNDPSLLGEMGSKARSFARTTFSLRNIDQLVEIMNLPS